MSTRFFPIVIDAAFVASLFGFTMDEAEEAMKDAESYDKADLWMRKSDQGEGYSLYAAFHSQAPKGFEVQQLQLYGFGACYPALEQLVKRGHHAGGGTAKGADVLVALQFLNAQRAKQGRAPIPPVIGLRLVSEGLGWG